MVLGKTALLHNIRILPISCTHFDVVPNIKRTLIPENSCTKQTELMQRKHKPARKALANRHPILPTSGHYITSLVLKAQNLPIMILDLSEKNQVS